MAASKECLQLERPVPETILKTVLAILLLSSYLPQIYRFKTKGSTFGISIYYVAFNVLVSTSQLTNTLYFSAYYWKELYCVNSNGFPKRNPRYRGPELTGFAAYSALLSLLQVAIVWLLSVIIFIYFTIQPLVESSNKFWPSKTTGLPNLNSTRPFKLRPCSLSITAVLWAILFLIPAVIICLPRPTNINENWTLSGFNSLIQSWMTIPAAFIFTVLSFISQIRLTWTLRGLMRQSVLSVTTLALHLVAFVWLGISWIIELHRATPVGNSRIPWLPASGVWNWYFAFGWYWFIPVSYGVGQCILLSMYLYYRNTDNDDTLLVDEEDLGGSEREPLLGNV